MTEQENITWPPREALRWYPEKPFPWSWIIGPAVFLSLVVVLSLPAIAAAL